MRKENQGRGGKNKEGRGGEGRGCGPPIEIPGYAAGLYKAYKASFLMNETSNNGS